MRRITRRRIKTNVDIATDDRKYRLHQFYAILLKADKARLLALRECDLRMNGTHAKQA